MAASQSATAASQHEPGQAPAPAEVVEAARADAAQVHDLLIVIDRTYSMRSFLTSLNSSMQDIIRISATTACFSRIGVLGYSDYDCDHAKVTDWSGWHSRDATLSEVTQDALLSFVKKMDPWGGHSYPEAAKTGLAHAYQLMRPDAQTLVLLFADAPPHTEQQAVTGWQAEQDALRKPRVYGGTGNRFADWVSAANTLSQGNRPAQIFTIIEPSSYQTIETTALYTYLSERTGGICIAFPRNPTTAAISKLTVGLLVAWMGADKQGAKPDFEQLASHARFIDAAGIDQFKSERDPDAARHLPVSRVDEHKRAMKANLNRSPLSLDKLAQIVPRREHPVMNFAARYKTDPEYKEIVIEQLTEIIESDVSAITLNPVFGTLWRTVCNDRLNPARDGLITKFGLQVDRMEGAKKESMKKWLEESYDWAGEILHIIQSVPSEARYPCVFLDPTLNFGKAEDDEDANTWMKFTRDELLEIGRSCDYRILRRLGRVLTRLTYVNSEEELPAHIKAVPEADLPRIPLALVQSEHNRKFWKMLLHTVLPGTMLAARPSALLAALSLRMGIKPLETAAYTELFAWRDNWNTLDIPETWNTNCLSLLLEADQKHQQSMADSQTPVDDSQSVLKAEDRALFQALVNYKLLEMNLDTTLEAEVGWTPNKTTIPLGPTVICKACQFPRSVTVMSEDGVCGLCASVAVSGCPEGFETEDVYLKANVAKADSSTTPVAWSECSMTDCGAQYVVYHPAKLNVRPKCHYCRQQRVLSTKNPDYARLTTSPCVTCTKCLNRIIYPEVYRPSDFNPSTYTCPACDSNHRTITTLTTTPRTLSTENGTAFLLRNTDSTIPASILFQSRSLFHIITHLTTDRSLFPANVSVLPQIPNLTLTLAGKTIHNTPTLLTSLAQWISARRVQRGTCTLCFSHFPKHALALACGGRRGCRQLVCGECALSWYGINAVGRVVNVSALSCPFCRRQPTAKVKLPGGLRVLAGLGDAVRERGEWVYGWCCACGCAKRHVERVCAQGGGAEEVEGWKCEGCVVKDVEGEGGGLVVRACPGCGVATEKVAGCDHMECTVEGCGVHWCWNCGVGVGEGEIYKHMSEEHGGWYGGRQYEVEMEDYYTEEDYNTEEE